MQPLTVVTGILRGSAASIAMTGICAASFIGLVNERRWWWIPQAGIWAGLGLIVLYYLP